jgi:hypothetical protein
VLIFRNLPREKIDTLKPGDYFIGSPILSLRRLKHTPTSGEYKYIFITTMSGAIFTAHLKNRTYNVFKRKLKEEPK